MTTATLKYGRWTHDANTLSPAALHYLLQNGFTQSMTDAAAMTRAERAKILREAGHEADAHIVETRQGVDISLEGAAVIAAQVDAWRQSRYEDIIAGKVGTRVGGTGSSGPRDPLAKEMKRVATERVYAIASAKKLARPTGEVLKVAVERVLAKFADDIRAEATANLARHAEMADDAGDIFADLEGDATAVAAE